MNEPQGHTYLKEHTLRADALLLDLKDQAAKILDEARASDASRAARTLVKDGPLRVTMVGFKEGGALREHKAGGPVAIQVMQGEVEVGVGETAQPLTTGQCLVLGANIEHSLVAHQESVIVLTIAMAG